jgi:S1-C subfamily serine protease
MIAFAKGGISFKFESKSGFDEVIEFKPSFFAGQLLALSGYVKTPYAVDATALPASDPGIDLYDMGHINKRLYEGVDHGLNVSSVAKGSPADLAGIKHGDIVLDLDSYRLDKVADYKAALSNFHSGQVVQVKVKQHGQVNTLPMML